MTRLTCAASLGFAFLAATASAQQPSRTVVQQWPDPLSFGVVRPDAEALRDIPDLKLSVIAAPMVQGSNKPFAIQAGIDPGALRLEIEQTLQAARIPLSTESSHALNLSVGLTCSPVADSVCMAQLFLVLHEPATTMLGKKTTATVWEHVMGFLVPESNLQHWLPIYLNRAVDGFVADWKKAHP